MSYEIILIPSDLTFVSSSIAQFYSTHLTHHWGKILTVFLIPKLMIFWPRFKFQSDDPQTTVLKSCLLPPSLVINQRKSRWTSLEEEHRISEVIMGPGPSNQAGPLNLPSIHNNIHRNLPCRKERPLPLGISNRWLFTTYVFVWNFLVYGESVVICLLQDRRNFNGL